MGGQALNCPLCCNESFDSKQSLIDHLTIAAENLYCPVCAVRYTSVVNLIEHLTLDNCQSSSSLETVVFYENGTQDNGFKNSTVQNSKVYQNDNISTSNAGATFTTTSHSYDTVDSDVNKMYADLLSKQLTKPSLQMQELKLVKENGESQYMILTQDSTDGTTIVTKQNNDGTISLTSVNDMKIETDAMIMPDVETEDNSDEIYSCNTCKVSFSSVLEHIQNYHNDQDVVVEEPIEENEPDSSPVEYDVLENEDPMLANDKQPPRRVITDTGDIVEEPLMFKNDPLVQQKVLDGATENEHCDNSEVKSTVHLQNERIIKDISQEEKSGGPYHKVIVKEVVTDSGYAVKMYQCMTCNICVSNLNEFKTHPCKAMKYSCPHCPVTYENSKSLCAHMKVHKSKDGVSTGSQTYECEICNTVFLTNKSLKLHKRMHDPIKSRPIDPPLENTDGTVVSEDRYLCTICDKMIPEDYRAIHAASHRTSDRMNCTVCNKKFMSAEYLEMHMNVHNLDKVPISKQDKSLPYSCLYCNRRFARPHEKVKHERIHTGEKPHSCEICGKSFRVSYCLTLHMRTHTGARPYSCNICGKRFKAHSVYNHHLLTHSEVRAYKCPYCPKAFKTSVQLAGHKNSHTKPFSCQHCNRPFASLYAVRVHTETHLRQNNLKFSCIQCGASYARAFALKDHMKQVHKRDVDNVDVTLNKDDENWAVTNSTDADGIHPLSKDLQQDIDLEINANELIVP